MQPRIQLLPEDLINKIAAGEVIERPASVVKELVENSIDAGATRITVDIQGAGGKMVRISDNGHGMTKEEVEISVQRHSTSKINSVDDLFNIQSLGFRGEAIPSIASVSKLNILSQSNGSGTRLKLEGGKQTLLENAGAPQGTTITIKDLFFNTPARKKFMKSPATEMGHIGNIVSKYALANPNISFKLISDGKPLLTSPGSGNLKDAAVAVYGIDLVKGLVETEFQFRLGKVHGLISLPTLTRIDKNYETFFVNKRYVRNFLLNRALEEGYRTLIPGNRYPVAILFIDIDPKQIDVNVHPTKREVKFVKTNEVMQAISDAVRKALVKDDQNIGTSERDDQMIRVSEEPNFLFNSAPFIPSQEIELEVSGIQPLFPIYQYKGTYIICTDGEELVLIDQHAAHERIIYDRLSKLKTENNKQTLLIPENVELAPKDKATLAANIDQLKDYGFEIEDFGNNTYIIRSVPAVSAKSAPKQLLIDLVSDLGNLGKATQLEIKKENIRKLIACHSAIKAGDKLTAEEMNQLIRDLYTTETPLTCPHGRPTMVKIGKEELKKRFGRT
ncbi:MAG: DNA mismatch repair endonuclease MutL [Candidatus Margulisiibacteriota bacterium]|nr:DNA mismatch repair endonuclease MutL [Candidatus Margulisiibacteriota bacterium]